MEHSSQSKSRFDAAFEKVAGELLWRRSPGGHWVGELSSSALSTATAVTALSVFSRRQQDVPPEFSKLIERGLSWLARNANSDGGWGDTIKSISNISTTALGWAAFGAARQLDARPVAPFAGAVTGAESWLRDHAGGIEPARLMPAILKRYGRDKTFSVPIVTACVVSGRFGDGKQAWRHVLQLPFELAALPPGWFGALRLPVVSYALPALIAMGQARHYHRPSRNPLARWIRNRARHKTLRVLERIQPSNGGFLEATPLTSFVVMSMAASGLEDHPVTLKGVEFLRRSARADGSWAIDTNLATWVTTLSVEALGGELAAKDGAAPARICSWLLAQQHTTMHPYTNAAPGGWAWTDLPGGVPDADDTAGAVLALRKLRPAGEAAKAARAPTLDECNAAALAGVQWLLDLQNSDGGIPTFCGGWGALPFDRSSPDLTAHAIRAWLAWHDEIPGTSRERVRDSLRRALKYLVRTQRETGAWIPLWFGNQSAPDDENQMYGTARVMRALSDALGQKPDIPERELASVTKALSNAVGWCLFSQAADGSWSGFRDGPPSVEETALAVEALASLPPRTDPPLPRQLIGNAAERGADWLLGKVESGEWLRPSPIGFYFAKLWYYESLYPLIFTAGALNRLRTRF